MNNKEFYCNTKSSPIQLPPYGRVVLANPSTIHQSIIFTGKDAWQSIKNPNFYPTSNKLLLPFGKEPEQYVWPVKETEVIIFSRGEPETKEQLIKLSKALLRNGANFILWALPSYPVTKIERKVKHHELS